MRSRDPLDLTIAKMLGKPSGYRTRDQAIGAGLDVETRDLKAVVDEFMAPRHKGKTPGENLRRHLLDGSPHPRKLGRRCRATQAEISKHKSGRAAAKLRKASTSFSWL